MQYFIDINSIKSSVEYFRNSEFTSDEMLFLYLLARHMGISRYSKVTFRQGALSAEDKEKLKIGYWKFAGLIDPSEKGGRNCGMFPNGLRTQTLYQPGTDFEKQTGRLADTLEKKNTNANIFQYKTGYFSLSRDFQKLLEQNYLNGEKISLRHLAVWLHRFIGFSFDGQPNPYEFRKAIKTATNKFLRISKDDFLWLFHDDLHDLDCVPFQERVSGEDFRKMLQLEAEPSVVSGGADARNADYSFFDSETVQHLIALASENPSPEEIKNVLTAEKQIILTGVPGIGKTFFTDSLKKDFKNVEVIQFHPSYSYQDFIFGRTLEGGNTGTAVKNQGGVFLNFVERAKKDKEGKYLFIIDEINRGNVAEIFGETILALDRRYSVSLPAKIKISLPDGSKEEEITEFKIPPNVYIVGTMNTSDRNIAFLDLALRRRFAFIDLKPDYDFLSEKVSIPDYPKLDLGVALKRINTRILEVLQHESFLLGQSYFVPRSTGNDEKLTWTLEALRDRFNYGVLPTLREYSYNDANVLSTIVGAQLATTLRDTEEFWEAFVQEFQLLTDLRS